MELYTAMSTSPTDVFRRFNPADSNDGAVPVSHTTDSRGTSCAPLLPAGPEHVNTNAVASEGSEPCAEPLDLSTRSEKDERPGQDFEELVSDASETHVLDFSTISERESPAKLVSLKFCECFTGKHQVGDYFACYCNGTPVFILRSKLQPLSEDEKVGKNLGTPSPVPQGSPSLTFSSLDSSPPQLVMDLPSLSSDIDLNSPRKRPKQASLENRKEIKELTPVEALSLSQEARHMYKFESDEDLKSLGTFSGYRLKAEPMKTQSFDSQTKEGLSWEVHCFPKDDQETLGIHHIHHASDMDVTQNISTRPPIPGSDSTIISCMGDLTEQHATCDYNADVSATQITGIDSSASDDDPHAFTWLIKEEEDKSSSDLRLKLRKTFVIKESDKHIGERQGCEHSERGLHDKTFSIVSNESETTEAKINPCSRTSQQPASMSPNMNTTVRFVEGRSICEASTIASASPTFVATTPMSSCVSYPATPDISFHSSKNTNECALLALPTRHRPVIKQGRKSSTPNARGLATMKECRKSSTPNARGPVTMKECRKSSTPNARGLVTMKDTWRVTKTGDEISLRRAMLEKKVSAQGSDSILNLGFTSELELNQHDLPPPNVKDEAGIFKKPKWTSLSFFKNLKQKIICQSNNMSVISTLDNSAQQDPSTSERVKAALQPLTTITKRNRFSALSKANTQPFCGKTATTSTTTVAFATLSETKQSQASGHMKPAQSRIEEANVPRLNTFPSVRSLGTSTSTLDHLVAPLDLSLSKSSESSQIQASLAAKKGSNFHPSDSSSADQDLFKVPKIPASPRTPARNHQGRPLASLVNLHHERHFSGRSREDSARTCTESSLSESNVMSWATQQSFDIKMMKRSARSVAELLTAFIGDTSIVQFRTQIRDALSQSMLFSLCEKCEVRVKQSKSDPSLFSLVKSRRSQLPTQEDVKQLVRRARRTRNSRQLSSMF